MGHALCAGAIRHDFQRVRHIEIFRLSARAYTRPKFSPMRTIRTSIVRFSAVLFITALAAQSAKAALVANFTYDNGNTNTLTMTLSGSLTVINLSGTNAWATPAASLDLWRDMTKVTGSPFTTVPIDKTYNVGLGITASSGASSIALDKVWFYYNGRNDFSFSFANNPDPVFGIGDVVNFSGTAIVDLGTDTAGMFNEGTWTGPSVAGDPYYWTAQFSDSFFGPDLTITTKVVPEPGTWAAAALLAGAAGFVGWRRRRA